MGPQPAALSPNCSPAPIPGVHHTPSDRAWCVPPRPASPELFQRMARAATSREMPGSGGVLSIHQEPNAWARAVEGERDCSRGPGVTSNRQWRQASTGLLACSPTRCKRLREAWRCLVCSKVEAGDPEVLGGSGEARLRSGLLDPSRAQASYLPQPAGREKV